MTDGFDVVLHATSALIEGEFRQAWVGITYGVLRAISGTPFGENLVELAEDEVLIPGIVDTHVHVNEPGRTEWEGFASATRAAAAGGVTTLLDRPRTAVPDPPSVAGVDGQ